MTENFACQVKKLCSLTGERFCNVWKNNDYSFDSFISIFMHCYHHIQWKCIPVITSNEKLHKNGNNHQCVKPMFFQHGSKFFSINYRWHLTISTTQVHLLRSAHCTQVETTSTVEMYQLMLRRTFQLASNFLWWKLNLEYLLRLLILCRSPP